MENEKVHIVVKLDYDGAHPTTLTLNNTIERTKELMDEKIQHHVIKSYQIFQRLLNNKYELIAENKGKKKESV